MVGSEKIREMDQIRPEMVQIRPDQLIRIWSKADDLDESKQYLGQSRRSWTKTDDLCSKADDLVSPSRRSSSKKDHLLQVKIGILFFYSQIVRFGSKYLCFRPSGSSAFDGNGSFVRIGNR